MNDRPLILIGVRSQMSSVGKNILTYTQDIMGEAVSLQDRFPMAVFGYTLPPATETTGYQTVGLRSLLTNVCRTNGRGQPPTSKERGPGTTTSRSCWLTLKPDPPTLRTDLIKAIVPEPQRHWKHWWTAASNLEGKIPGWITSRLITALLSSFEARQLASKPAHSFHAPVPPSLFHSAPQNLSLEVPELSVPALF